MCLGSLLLEGENSEYWVALGCLSNHNVLRQHALIRGLQLDISLAVSWAFLGKVMYFWLTSRFCDYIAQGSSVIGGNFNFFSCYYNIIKSYRRCFGEFST